MKTGITLIVTTGLFLSGAVASGKEYSIRVNGGVVTVSPMHETVYISASPDVVRNGTILESEFTYRDFFEVSGGSFRMAEVRVISRKHAVANGNDIRFLRPGTATFSVAYSGQSVRIPVKVVRLNVRRGSDAGSVIDDLGDPDGRRLVKRRRPVYGPATGRVLYHEDVAVEQWRYDEHPGAVIEFETGRVTAVRSVDTGTYSAAEN